VKLLDVLDRCAAEIGKTLPVLLQVNAGLDPAKSARSRTRRRGSSRRPSAEEHPVDGLMTIAPLSDDPGSPAGHLRG